MHDKTKYAMLLVIVVFVSVITTYITHLTLNANEQYTQEIPDQSLNPQNTSDTSKTKISPSYEVRLDPQPHNSIVTVNSAVSLEDLTIVYHLFN